MLMGSLEVGSPLIVMRKFSVSRFWQVARENGVTKLLSIGAIPSLLLTAPESPADREHSVDLAMAVAVPKDQHAELEERFGFPWVETYGSSESGPAIAMPIRSAARYTGSGALGIPVPEMEARLVDADGNVLEGAASGELEIAGEILFEGYLNNPEATAEVMHDGWLRSGDLMRRDEDNVYYFLGRRKELIRRGGENIAPAEVEAVIRLHPDVIDTAVVPVEDPIRGEEVFAYVQVDPGTELPPAEIVEFCAERLAPYKVPRFVRLRTEPFPRTPSQRIPKKELMVDGRHSTESAWDREQGG
jgi:crotonobetaine/carnitine-CoA ligase